MRNGWIIFLSTIFLLSGCVKSTTEDAILNKQEQLQYQEFLERVDLFNAEFVIQNYDKISIDTPVNLTRAFGESQLDPRQSDAYENNTSQPSRYEFFFLNQPENIGVKVNMVYFPAQINNGIQSIDIISNVDNSSLMDEYHDLLRPTIYQINLTHDGIIYNLFFWSTQSKKLTDDEVTAFIQETSKFHEAFESFLVEKYSNNVQ